MAISTQTQNLNLIPGKAAPVVVHLSQGNVGDTIQFYLYNGADPYIPSNVSVAVHGIRADGTAFGPYTVTTITDSNLVSFAVETAMTSVSGAAVGELVITDAGRRQIGTANFGMIVEAAPYSSGVTYEDDLSIYQRILAYVNSITVGTSELIANEKSRAQNAEELLSTRIDQIIAPSGEAPSAAEVTDARIGADGVTYGTLGTSIRTQFSNLKNYVAQNDVIPQRTNLINGICSLIDDVQSEYVLVDGEGVYASTGEFVVSANLSRTNKLIIPYGCKAIFTNLSTQSSYNGYAFYDSNGSYLNGEALAAAEEKYIPVPYNAAFFAISKKTSSTNLEKLRFITDYSILNKVVTTNNLALKLYVGMVCTASDFTANSNYYCSDYISINSIKTFKNGKHLLFPCACSVNFYVNNNTYQRITNKNAGQYSAIPGTYIVRVDDVENANYVRINVPVANLSPSEFWAIDVVTRTYYKTASDPILNGWTSKLVGKTVFSFGDSLMYGNYSGRGILDTLCERFHMGYGKFAVNGAHILPSLKRMPSGTVPRPIINYINNAISSYSDIPDFVIMDGGINDTDIFLLEDGRLGVLSSSFDGGYDTDTFIGSLENIFYTLRNHYTTSRFIYVIHHKVPQIGTSPHSPESQEAEVNAVLSVCSKWAIPVVDMYHEGEFNAYISALRSNYTYDTAESDTGGNGLHLNDQGYTLFYMPRIVDKMCSLINSN